MNTAGKSAGEGHYMTHPVLEHEEIRLNLGGLRMMGRLRIFRAADPVEMQSHENQFELLYMYSGRKVFYIGDEKYVLNGGDVLMVFPGEVHGAEDVSQNRTLLYYLLFDDPSGTADFCCLSELERGQLSGMLYRIDHRLITVSQGIKRSFDELFVLVKGLSPLRETRIKHFALEIFWQVISSSKHAGHSTPEDIQIVKDYISTHAYEMPTVGELAMLVHLSVPRFKQKFKQETGVPPAEYIIRHKVDLAEQWLTGSNRRITDIALDLGFSSSQHFSVVFQKYCGQAPLNYRRSHREGQP
jgi:AraC-like DNA-binding protein/quercetin dioxygenase-like cupin family protein